MSFFEKFGLIIFMFSMGCLLAFPNLSDLETMYFIAATILSAIVFLFSHPEEPILKW